MFLYVCAILFTRGFCPPPPPVGRPGGVGQIPPGCIPPDAEPPRPDTSTSGRYASYWNAFLFFIIFVTDQCEHLTGLSGSDNAFTFESVWTNPYTQWKRTQLFLSLSLIHVNIKLDSLLTYLKATSPALSVNKPLHWVKANVIFTARKRSNVFTPAYHSVHSGGRCTTLDTIPLYNTPPPAHRHVSCILFLVFFHICHCSVWTLNWILY